jgi:TP901 family phage tail tape measure protein
LLSQGLTAGVSNAFRIVSTVAIRGLQISLAGLAGTFMVTAKAGAEFQDEIVRAFVIMKEGGNAAAGALSQLTEKALELGRDTLFSATDAAEGMQILARAGFNTREVLDSIGPVLDMAINGELELAESSEILVSAIRGFNLNAEDSKKVADVMTMGANAASTSLGELGEAFSYVAPVAMASGLSIEEVTAAIGLLSDSGIKGSMAGTSLRRILSELLAPTGKAKDIFKDANLTFTDSSGRLKHLTSIVRDLQKANLTAGQVFEAFGDRAASGVEALIIRGAPALMELQTQLENSQGAADRMSQAFRTTVIGRVRDLFASLKNLGLGFSQQFNEPLAKAIYAVRNFIVDITDIANRMGLFKAAVNGVQKVMAPVIQWIKEWSIGFKKWLSELTPQKVTTFFDNIATRVATVVKSLREGELKKIFEEVYKTVLTMGKAIIGTISEISKAYLAMPEGLKNIVRPMAVWSTLILHLLGGFMNILIFVIAIKAVFIPIIAGAGKLILLFKYGWVAIAGIQITLAAIAGILVGLTIDKLLGEFLRFRQIATAVLILFGAIGPTLKLAAMGLLAFSQPWRLLNKDFKDEMSATVEDIKIKIGALKEIDWLGKNKPEGETGKEVVSPKGTGYLEVGGKRIDLETIEANKEVEAIKKMISQSERIGGALGPSIRTSLLVGLQGRLDELEKIVMDQEGDISALNRQTIKPEADRKNKARIGAGLE